MGCSTCGGRVAKPSDEDRYEVTLPDGTVREAESRHAARVLEVMHPGAKSRKV